MHNENGTVEEEKFCNMQNRIIKAIQKKRGMGKISINVMIKPVSNEV